jgi:hypothetical protein
VSDTTDVNVEPSNSDPSNASPAPAPAPADAVQVEPDIAAPFGRNADGSPVAPYGLKADGTPRRSNGGRRGGADDQEAAKQRERLASVTPRAPRGKPAASMPSPAPVAVDYQAMAMMIHCASCHRRGTWPRL